MIAAPINPNDCVLAICDSMTTHYITLQHEYQAQNLTCQHSWLVQSHVKGRAHKAGVLCVGARANTLWCGGLEFEALRGCAKPCLAGHGEGLEHLGHINSCVGT